MMQYLEKYPNKNLLMFPTNVFAQ